MLARSGHYPLNAIILYIYICLYIYIYVYLHTRSHPLAHAPLAHTASPWAVPGSSQQHPNSFQPHLSKKQSTVPGASAGAEGAGRRGARWLIPDHHLRCCLEGSREVV